jgi:predicted DNA-binding transcriptional regulator AlpA
MTKPQISRHTLTEDQLRALPSVVNIETAGYAFGMSRPLSYDLARNGNFPVPVLKVGKRYRVPTAAILTLLGVDKTAHTEHTQASTCEDEATNSRRIRLSDGRTVTIDPARTYRYKGERITGAELLRKRLSGRAS